MDLIDFANPCLVRAIVLMFRTASDCENCSYCHAIDKLNQDKIYYQRATYPFILDPNTIDLPLGVADLLLTLAQTFLMDLASHTFEVVTALISSSLNLYAFSQ